MTNQDKSEDYACSACSARITSRNHSGLCRRCYQKKFARDQYRWHLDHKICPRCRLVRLGRDERLCPECRAANLNQVSKAYQDPVKKAKLQSKNRAMQRVIYNRRKEQGVCVKCGKMKEDERGTLCRKCKAKSSQWYHDKHITYTIDDGKTGLCHFCKKPNMPGRKVCPNCYERLIKQLDNPKVRASRKAF